MQSPDSTITTTIASVVSWVQYACTGITAYVVLYVAYQRMANGQSISRTLARMYRNAVYVCYALGVVREREHRVQMAAVTERLVSSIDDLASKPMKSITPSKSLKPGILVQRTGTYGEGVKTQIEKVKASDEVTERTSSDRLSFLTVTDIDGRRASLTMPKLEYKEDESHKRN